MANIERGHYPLRLYVSGSNGDGKQVDFTVRLTFNAVCQATAALSLALGRDFTTQDISSAFASGYSNFNVLRQLFFESVRGQHGIHRVEDAGDLMERNSEMLFMFARTLAQSFNDLFPDTLVGLEDAIAEASADADGAEGNP